MLELLRPYIFEYLNSSEMKLQLHKKLKGQDVFLPNQFSKLWNKFTIKNQVAIAHELFSKIIVSADSLEVFFKDGNSKILYWMEPINIEIVKQNR